VAAVAGRPNRWATVAKLLVALIATGVLVAGLFMPFVLGSGILARNEASKWLDTSCNLQETKPPQPTTLYANDGKTVLARLFTQDRKPVALDQVPQYLQDALIATEDRRFYSHHGVDLRGLIRSAVNTTSGDTQGGSTLTMQYVKQIRYYQAGDDKKKQQAAIAVTIQRKMEDAKCALEIEGPRHETKKQILENYLNIAFFGEHAYGIQVAAETYFARPVNKLTLAQSALLVGMLRAPTAYDPFYNLAAAKQRRDEVLQNLVDVGKLSQVEADRQKATPVALATKAPPLVKQGCANADTNITNAAFFCEYAVNWLRNVDKISESLLETGGLKIVTTIDPKIQNSAQKGLSTAVPAKSPMTAVLPVLDPKTGNVLAMAASKTYGAANKTQTEQPIFTKYTANGASTFKLFPLLAALSTGVPSSWLLQTTGNQGTYKSKNCVTKSNARNGDASINYNSLETLKTATEKSSNTYFVALADKLLGCDLTPIVDIMSKLGMKGMQQPSDVAHQTWAQTIVAKQRAQALTLGQVPTSPLELAGAYAAIANKGFYNTPAPIVSIKTQSGSALQVKRTPGVQAVAPQVAAQAAQILKGDTDSTNGTSASKFTSWYSDHSEAIAGKTGTNESTKKNANGSIWFVGMTPKLVAASGLINFDQSSAPSTGLPGEKTGAAYGDYAAKVWLAALKPTLSSQNWSWPDPDSVDGDIVPDVTGQTLDAARKTLAESHFKMTVLGEANQLLCPSSQPLESVAYYGPSKALPGSTITVCPSSQVPAYEPPPPPPPIIPSKTKTKTKTPGHGGNGGTRHGNRNGNGRTRHRPVH
jgi:membrane peptidoglycan carboxypeptidase